LFVGINQPRNAATNLGHLRFELFVSLLLRVGIVAFQPPLQLALHAGRIGQQLAHVVPHRLIEQVLAWRLAAAQPLAATAAGLAARRAIVAITTTVRPMAGVPAVGADHQSLKQMSRSAAALTKAFAVLRQLLGGQVKQGLLDDRRHRNPGPLLRWRLINALAAARDSTAAAHRPQTRTHRPAAGLAVGRRALVGRIVQHALEGWSAPAIHS